MVVRGHSLGLIACAALLAACAGGAEAGSAGGSFGPVGPGGTATDGDALTSGADGTMGGGPGNGPGNGVGDPDSATGFLTTGDTDPTGGGGPDCFDMDGDGYGEGCAAGIDCNDADVDINPGVMERCDDVDWNCDDDTQLGCECPDDGVGGNCNLPYDLGSLDTGSTAMGVVGNVPIESTFDWYQVSFPAATRPGEGMPTIGFAINESDAFVFDVVYDQCGAGGMPCGNAAAPDGIAEGLTDWTFVDDDPGCCTEPMDALVEWPNQIYVRVYRTTPGSSCAAYQLQVSR